MTGRMYSGWLIPRHSRLNALTTKVHKAPKGLSTAQHLSPLHLLPHFLFRFPVCQLSEQDGLTLPIAL